MNKVSVIFANFLVFLLEQTNYMLHTRGFTIFETFLYNLLVKYKLEYMFFLGYNIGQLIDSEYLKNSKNTRTILEVLLCSPLQSNGKRVLKEHFDKNDKFVDSQISRIFFSSTGSVNIDWCIHYFNGLLYFASQEYKLNFYCKTVVNEGAKFNVNQLNVEYENILRLHGQLIGFVITLPHVDSNKNIVGYTELFVFHSNDKKIDLQKFSEIDEEQLQRITNQFEQYSKLYDNDITLFRDYLDQYLQKNIIDIKYNISLVSVCFFTEAYGFSRVAIHL